MSNETVAKWIELPLDCSQCQKYDVGITRSGLRFQFHEYYSNAMQAVFLNCFGEEFRVWRLGQQFLTGESPMDIVRIIRIDKPSRAEAIEQAARAVMEWHDKSPAVTPGCEFDQLRDALAT